MKRSERNARDRELLRQTRPVITTLRVPLNSPECPFIFESGIVKPRRPIPPSLQVMLTSVHDAGGYFWRADFESTPGMVEMAAWGSREDARRFGVGRP